jgi:hypothetical protein
MYSPTSVHGFYAAMVYLRQRQEHGLHEQLRAGVPPLLLHCASTRGVHDVWVCGSAGGDAALRPALQLAAEQSSA